MWDDEGFEIEIVAAAESGGGFFQAWVDCRSKEFGSFLNIAYHLRVRRKGKRVLDWEVETYNPYFGCDVRWMAWWGDTLALLYREKHHSYVVRWRHRERLLRKRLADEWLVYGDHLIYRSEAVDRVERMRLPSLEELEPWPVEVARERGLAPEGYDGLNEIARR